MSLTWWGALLGGTCGFGLLVVARRIAFLRRPQLAVRVLPYLRDVPQASAHVVPRTATTPVAAAGDIFGPLLVSAARLVERVLGGGASVRRRLARAGTPDVTVQEFRIEQVVWGLLGFAGVAAFQLLRAWTGGVSVAQSLIACALGFVGGVLLRDQTLGSRVSRREREMLAEFPTIAELLALAVATGESPVAALDRVVRRSNGELSAELAHVLGRIRTGEPVTEAFHALAATTGLPMVARFAIGVSVAVERGTPLASVLHAQAADVREAGRRALIETAARKEVSMMAPVVFLVLPVTILFAFFPGVIGLRMVAP